MKRRAVAAATAVATMLLAACGGGGGAVNPSASAGLAAPGVRQRQLSFDGSSRNYRVFSPSAPTTGPGLPLVVVLGGVGDSAQSMTNATQFDQRAATGNFVVAYPESAGPSWNAGFCCAGPDSNAVDDVGFLNLFLDQLERDYRIDAARVYTVGVSAGAMMAYRWACADAGRIAGVGSVAGAMLLDGCHPAKAVSIIEIHGTADPIVPYTGGAVAPAGVATQAVPSSAAVIHDWASLDACPNPPAVQMQTIVTTTTWSDCAAGTSVRLVAIAGGGHTWTASGYGPVDGAVDATQQIWSYLNSHARTS